jgi:hypothetical protein
VEAHYGTPQDIEWAVLDAPFDQADADSAAPGSPGVPGAGGSGAGGSGAGGSGAGGSGAGGSAESRVVLLQSRPETVWSARDPKPAGAPKPRAADHVLSLFGKPL